MASGKITLEVVTPKGVTLHQEVDDVAAPSVEGEFGVLPGHLPLLAALRIGIVTYHQGGEEKKLAVGEGFVEVKDDRTLLLTDRVATREQIDPVKVQLELKEVDEKLELYGGAQGSPEWQELVSRELWAAVQLELYGYPPSPTQRPFEQFGPPAPTTEQDMALPEASHESRQ